MENHISRRSFLMTSGALGSAAAVAAHAVSIFHPPPTLLRPCRRCSTANAPPLSCARRGSRRCSCRRPMNVYYVTGAVPVMSRFTQINMTAALLPADLKRPIAYVGGGFEFYAGVADAGLDANVEPYLVGGSLGDADSRSSPAFARVGAYQFDAREQRRRALLDRAAPFHESIPAALRKALRDRALGGGSIGFDTADAKALLDMAAARATLRPADDCMLNIRMVEDARRTRTTAQGIREQCRSGPGDSQGQPVTRAL